MKSPLFWILYILSIVVLRSMIADGKGPHQISLAADVVLFPIGWALGYAVRRALSNTQYWYNDSLKVLYHKIFWACHGHECIGGLAGMFAAIVIGTD